MIKRLPSIFVGSSSEGLPIAKKIAQELSAVAECKIWNKTFQFGNAAYEDLVKNLPLYDYGVLVATKDDKVISRGVSYEALRDNVLLEFGLFVGHLGRQRSFLFAEKGLRIPSDLSGITLPFFSDGRPEGWFRSREAAKEKQREDIEQACAAVREHIRRRAAMFEFGYFPSTALAVGYFMDFVLKAITHLFESKSVTISNGPDVGKVIAYSEIEFVILVPTDLRSDMFDQVKAHRQKLDWQLVKIATSFRPYDFYVQIANSNGGKLYLSDIPLTLNALNETIKAHLGKTYVGISDAEMLIEGRELENFFDVLQHLIRSNVITRERVKVEFVDI